MSKTTMTYLDRSADTKRHRANPLAASVALVLAVFFIVAGVFTTMAENSRQAQAFDVNRWVTCLFGEDSMPVFMYEATQTDQYNFELRSKSAMSSGVNDVSGGLNSIIEMFGHDFQATNELILGTSLDPLEPSEDLDEEASPEDRFNTGPRVSPYDRFGVSGLNFTSYTGEWRYVIVDACNGGEPQDPKAGVFYDDRLEPQSTWDDIGKSSDVRTQQFDRGFMSQFGSAFLNVMANWIFVITKFMVVLTIALISFAFTDIVAVMGLDTLLAGDAEGVSDGLFGMLYDGLFTPLVIIAITMTALYIGYQAIFQRQFRKSMGALIRTIILFVAAIIIAAAPAFWVSAPNTIATVMQSIVVTSLNSGLSGGSGLCETDIGNTQIVDDESDDAPGILEQASKNMTSSISCQFWQTFLLSPWAEGQWGTGWHNTWANGVDDPNAGNLSEMSNLQNDNGDMVGEGDVPVGNDETVKNWAVFNISTNTNAHAPIDLPGERSKITNGVSNDWYRIVDAVANYQEEDIDDPVSGSGGFGDDAENIVYTQPADVPVLAEWNAWTGNEASGRVAAASSSVVIAGIGLAAPAFFAFLSALFSIGVSLLASLAPLFLLLGIWADRGWNIFLGWLQMLINTVIARIVLGALMALSVAMTMAAIRMMDDIGWWRGILILVLFSVVLIQSRHKIMNAVKVARMSAVDLSQTGSSLVQRTTGAVKGLGRAGVSGVAGGAVASHHGGSFSRGAGQALKTEFKNQMYRHPSAHRAMGQYEEARMATRGAEEGSMIGHQFCNACGARMSAVADRNGTPIMYGGRDDNGNIYCSQCFDDGVRDDLREMTIQVPESHLPENERIQKSLEEQEVDRLMGERFDKNKSSYQTSNSARNLIERVGKGVDADGVEVSNQHNTNQLKALMRHTDYDMKKHKAATSDLNAFPLPPEEIAVYLDPDMVAAAWRKQDYEWIRVAYTAAWVNWYHDMTGAVVEEKLDEILADMESRNPLEEPEVQDEVDRQKREAEDDEGDGQDEQPEDRRS